MDIVFLLIPLTLLLGVLALVGFIWAARSGQFEDVETPAVRVLFDDVAPRKVRGSAEPHLEDTDSDL